jgi:hypothetical protein
MERMTLQRKICDLQKKLLYLEGEIRRKENPVSHEKIPPSKPPEEPTPYTMFRDRVRADVAHNLRICHGDPINVPSGYEFLRTFFPMPGLNHLDERFQGNLRDTTQLMIGFERESVLRSLEVYRETYSECLSNGSRR